MQDAVVIVSAVRTPTGRLLGQLQPFSAHQLGGFALAGAVARAKLDAALIEQVYMGCVLQAGQGQAPARQAAFAACLPETTPCVTLNKMCGSGMQAVIYAHDTIASHTARIIAAGGMESMTHAPYLLLKAREGYRFGHHDLYDHMTLDGLEDAYEGHHPMGYFAERCAKIYGFTRKEQDDYAITSFERARYATQAGYFAEEIIPLTISTKAGEVVIARDEAPFTVDLQRLPTLPPVFAKDGTVTAGNASSIADGAAALILMHASDAHARNIRPLARIVGHATIAKAPRDFPTAPIEATRKLLAKLHWRIEEVDLFEVNEAFAVVVLALMRELGISHEKINVYGGSCALGHPIGASGARIIVTLLHALTRKGLKRGIATLCIGGGEATAIAVERMEG